jgi:DHA1 family multidrug resistance protein-like MFS transporter
LNWVIDVYTLYAASTLGVTSVLRSLAGGILPPTAFPPMYERLGVQWASTLLAGVALLLSTIPFVFMRYGRGMREISDFVKHG